MVNNFGLVVETLSCTGCCSETERALYSEVYKDKSYSYKEYEYYGQTIPYDDFLINAIINQLNKTEDFL